MNREQLERITNELMEIYGVQSPPVPIENMLQHPLENMWDELDITKLSSSFINVREYYSPRMSLARMLARHIVTSLWGRERGLDEIESKDDLLRAFARMLMMPSSLVLALSSPAHTPEHLSVHFEVPLEDAEQRLKELF